MTPDTGLSLVLPYLRCPHCSAGLLIADRVARCPAGHTFDIARQGYLGLLGAQPRTGPGDTATMVAARERFLAAGHYAPIARAVAEAVDASVLRGDRDRDRDKACIVELGAGTGYSLATVLDAAPWAVGIAVDISIPAVRRAARAHSRIGAVRADVWGRLPLRDASVAAVLNVFAPRNPAQTGRVLRPGGSLVTVTPTPAHLAGLVDALGLLRVDAGKAQSVAERLDEWFVPAGEQVRSGHLSLSALDVRAVVEMGPSSHHTCAPALIEAIERLPMPWADVWSVTVSTFFRRPSRIDATDG